MQVRSKGFTLIEVLVVMMILSILAGIGVGGYVMFFRKGDEARTQSLQTQIRVVLGNMNRDTGYYPPSVWSKAERYAKELKIQLDVSKIPDDGDANAGIEILYALIAEFEPLEVDANMVGDTDGDGLKEFLDGWMNPMVYMNADDARTVRTLVMIEGVEDSYQQVTVEPRMEEDNRRKFQGRCQLVSPGADAEFATDDDMVEAPRK